MGNVLLIYADVVVAYRSLGIRLNLPDKRTGNSKTTSFSDR